MLRYGANPACLLELKEVKIILTIVKEKIVGFIVKTPPVLRHKPHQCDLPETFYHDDKQNLYQPSYAHLTIWQCDECKKYWKYMDYKREICYPFLNDWKLISEKKALKLKSKWLIKQIK